jgi:uncharacterized metal-binding protein
MPSGKTHAALTALAAGGIYLGLSVSGYTTDIVYAATLGCAAGVLITPDLDVDQPIRSNYVVYQEAGFLPGMLWRALWIPYGLAIGHRSWISHFPIISTLIRLAYLGAIAWFIRFSWSFKMFIHAAPPIFLPPLPAWWPWAVAGLMVSDVLHWAADITATAVKRHLRRRKKAVKVADN